MGGKGKLTKLHNMVMLKIVWVRKIISLAKAGSEISSIPDLDNVMELPHNEANIEMQQLLLLYTYM